MKKFVLTIASVFLVSQMLLAQAPQGSPENLNWKVPESPRGPYFPPVFLKGNFIELGKSDAGSYGTTVPPDPALGFNYPYAFNFPGSISPAGLGFVADYEMNGWNTSSNPGVIPNHSGDYFLPGNPWEGFLVEFTYGGTEYTWRNCAANTWWEVTPTSLTNTSAGNTQSAVWTGTASAAGQTLLVEQNTYFNVNEARFFIEVTLTNGGSETLNDVEYARHVDPDNEQNWTNDYTTINYVSHPTGVDGFAEVVALGLVHQIPMSLRLYHPDAKASVNTASQGLLLNSPNEILDTPFTPTQGAPYVDDVGVGVAVRFPTLAPGASETFLVSYVLNQEEIDDPTPPDPDPPIPVSNWALYLGILLMITFVVIRFRRMI
jgi:hypothetical protein